MYIIKKCSIPECGRFIEAKGLCSAHYTRNRLYGSPFGRKAKVLKPPILCCMPSCTMPRKSKGFCEAHYRRAKKYGDPLGRSTATQKGEPLAWLVAHRDHAGTSCLIWPFSTGSDGYAHCALNGKRCVASRVMCALVYGPPPTQQHHAAHSCNRGHLGCIHPQHLSWKTPRENTADQVAHGTRINGEAKWNARLTEADVRAIRTCRGYTHQELATRYGVTQSYIGHIKRGLAWAHIE